MGKEPEGRKRGSDVGESVEEVKEAMT